MTEVCGRPLRRPPTQPCLCGDWAGGGFYDGARDREYIRREQSEKYGRSAKRVAKPSAEK